MVTLHSLYRLQKKYVVFTRFQTCLAKKEVEKLQEKWQG